MSNTTCLDTDIWLGVKEICLYVLEMEKLWYAKHLQSFLCKPSNFSSGLHGFQILQPG